MYFKKTIGVIVILSFLYGNCVYALPDGGNRHTLQPSSQISEISGLITRLAQDLKADRLSPEEVIKIVDEQLKTLAKEKELNSALASYIEEMKRIAANAREMSKNRDNGDSDYLNAEGKKHISGKNERQKRIDALSENAFIQRILKRRPDSEKKDRAVLKNFLEWDKPQEIEDIFKKIDQMTDDEKIDEANRILREEWMNIGLTDSDIRTVDEFIKRKTAGKDDFHQVFFGRLYMFTDSSDFKIYASMYDASSKNHSTRQSLTRVAKTAYIMLNAVEVLSRTMPNLFGKKNALGDKTVSKRNNVGIYGITDGRVFDVLIVLTTIVPAIVIGAILYIVNIALYCKWKFYAQRRIGYRGREIVIYKLRTMNESSVFGWFSVFLRKTGLDELPQLWSILKGDMAVFGPRPHQEKDFEHVRGKEDYIDAVLTVTKPGLISFCAAMVGPGRASEMIIDIVEKYDREQMQRHSFVWNTKLIIVLVWTLLFGNNEANRGMKMRFLGVDEKDIFSKHFVHTEDAIAFLSPDSVSIISGILLPVFIFLGSLVFTEFGRWLSWKNEIWEYLKNRAKGKLNGVKTVIVWTILITGFTLLTLEGVGGAGLLGYDSISLISIFLICWERPIFDYFTENYAKEEDKDKDEGEDKTEDEAADEQFSEIDENVDAVNDELAGAIDELNISNKAKHDLKNAIVKRMVAWINSKGISNFNAGEFLNTLGINLSDKVKQGLVTSGHLDRIYQRMAKMRARKLKKEGIIKNRGGTEARGIQEENSRAQRVRDIVLTKIKKHFGGGHSHIFIFIALGYALMRIAFKVFDIEVPEMADLGYLMPIIGVVTQKKPNPEDIQKARDIVETYTNDLVKISEAEGFDSTFYIEDVQEEVQRAIIQKKKNNAIITGDPDEVEGIVEALVEKAVKEPQRYPELARYKFLEFNTGRFLTSMADTQKFNSTVQELVKSLDIIAEADYKEIVLYINFQDLFNIGILKSGMSDATAQNAAQMEEVKRLFPKIELIFREAFNSKNVHIVGAVNDTAYEQFFMKNGKPNQDIKTERIELRVKMDIAEIRNKVEEYIEALKGKYTGWTIELDSGIDIEEILKLVRKYYYQGAMEFDKIFELIDRVVANKVRERERGQMEKNTYRARIKRITDKLIQAIQRQDKKAEEEYVKIIETNLSRINSAKDSSSDVEAENIIVIDEELLIGEIGSITKMGRDELLMSEGERFDRYEEEVQKGLIGQRKAVSAINTALQLRKEAGESTEGKPIGTFVFLGPTGVGKTQLAKLTAKALFGNEENLIRLDMSEFMGADAVQKLKGAPPGYVGFEDEGILTGALRKKPSCVLLLDEIEKAPPNVYVTLMEAIDKGYMTDSRGRRISLANVLIIMTSNLGTTEDFYRSIRFAEKDIDEFIQELYPEYYDDYKTALERGIGAPSDLIAQKEELDKEYNSVMDGKADSQLEMGAKYMDIARAISKIDPEQAADALTRAGLLFNNALQLIGKKEDTVDIVEKMLNNAISDILKKKQEELKTLVGELLMGGEHEIMPEQKWGLMLHALNEVSKKNDIFMELWTINKMITEILGTNYDENWKREKVTTLLLRIRELQESRKATIKDEILVKMKAYTEKAWESYWKGMAEVKARIPEGNVILFDFLTRSDLEKILDIQIDELSRLLKEQGYGGIELSDGVKKLLLDKGYDVSNGARPLERAIETYFKGPLAKEMLKDNIKKGQLIIADIDPSGEIVIFRYKDTETEKPKEPEWLIKVREEAEKETQGEIDLKSIYPETNLAIENGKQPANISVEKYRIEMGKEEEAKIRDQVMNNDSIPRNQKEAVIQQQIEGRKAQIEEVNEAFVNISAEIAQTDIMSESMLIDKTGQIIDILTRKKKNMPFIIGGTKDQRDEITKVTAYNATVGNIKGMEKLRIMNLKISKILSGFNTLFDPMSGEPNSVRTLGDFEYIMKKLLDEVKRDNEEKEMITIIQIDYDDAKTIVESHTVAPFLMGFFLRLFKRDKNIRFMFTSANDGVKKTDAFEKYFESVEIGLPKLDEAQEKMLLEEDDSSQEGIKTEIEAIVEALRLAYALFSQESADEKAGDWINTIKAEIKQIQTQDTIRDIDEIKKILDRLLSLIRRSKGSIPSSADELYIKVSSLYEKIERIRQKQEKKRSYEGKKTVNKEDIDRMVKEREKKYTNTEEERRQELLSIDQKLEERVFSQDEAIGALSDSVRIEAAGLKRKDKTKGVYLFLGPTGVGKTESAIALADIINQIDPQEAKKLKAGDKADDEKRGIIRIACNEYQQEHQITELVGVGASYVGYGKTDTLLEKVRRNPRAVIVFDEIEKAHPKISKLLLQIMDNGRASDQKGTVDFTNTTIIMTSNLGISRYYDETGKFVTEDGEHSVNKIYDEIKEAILSGDQGRIDVLKEKIKARAMRSVRYHFLPEFVNRINHVITFNPLDIDLFYMILKKRFTEIEKKILIEKKAQFVIGENEEEKEAVLREFFNMAYNPERGARNIQQIFDAEIMPIYIAKKKDIRAKDKVVLRYSAEKGFYIEIKKQEADLPDKETQEYTEEETKRAELVIKLLRLKKDNPTESFTERDIRNIIEIKDEIQDRGKELFFSDKAVEITTVRHADREDYDGDEINSDVIEGILDPVIASPSDVTSEGRSNLVGIITSFIQEAKVFAKRSNLEDTAGFDVYAKEIDEEARQRKLDNAVGEAEKNKKITLRHEYKKEGKDTYLLLEIKYNTWLLAKYWEILFGGEKTEEQLRELSENSGIYRDIEGLCKIIQKLKSNGAEIGCFITENGETRIWVKTKVTVKIPKPAQKTSLAGMTERIERILGVLKSDKPPAGGNITKPQVSEREILEEIKDIAKRIKEIFEFGSINEIYDDSGRVRTRTAVSIEDLKSLCMKQCIPYNAIAEFLIKRLKWKINGGMIERRYFGKKRDSALSVYIWIEVILRNAISGVSPLNQVDTEIMGQELIAALCRLLALNPDGTPVERKRIRPNLTRIFDDEYENVREVGEWPNDWIKISKEEGSEESIEVKARNPETRRGFNFKYNKVKKLAYAQAIASNDDFVLLSLSKNNYLEYEANPILNIGFSENKKKYVIVLQDNFYKAICKNERYHFVEMSTSFEDFRCAESSEISWEVISESECNYRLTVDPEFAEYFSWDSGNIVTGSIPASAMPVSDDKPPAGGGVTESQADVLYVSLNGLEGKKLRAERIDLNKIAVIPGAGEFEYNVARNVVERLSLAKIYDWLITRRSRNSTETFGTVEAKSKDVTVIYDDGDIPCQIIYRSGGRTDSEWDLRINRIKTVETVDPEEQEEMTTRDQRRIVFSKGGKGRIIIEKKDDENDIIMSYDKDTKIKLVYDGGKLFAVRYVDEGEWIEFYMAGGSIKALLPAETRKKDAEKEILDEIKDIARRLSLALGECFNVGFSLGNDIQKQRKIFAKQRLPHEIFVEAISITGFENVPRDFDLLESFFGGVADITDLKNMPELSGKLRKYKEQIYQILTLNPDGTSMERKRIKSDMEGFFEKVPEEQKYYKCSDEYSFSNINNEKGEIYIGMMTGRFGRIAFRFRMGETLSMTYGVNGGTPFEGVSSYEYDANSIPLITIGMVSNKYVFVIKDDLYNLIVEGGNASWCRVDRENLNWEIISESECNYRLTVDPEFAEYFSWDSGNIVTGSIPVSGTFVADDKLSSGSFGEKSEKIETRKIRKPRGISVIRNCRIGNEFVFMVKKEKNNTYNFMREDGTFISKSWFRMVKDPVNIGGECYFKVQNGEGKWNVIKPDGAPVREEWFRRIGDLVDIGGRCYFMALHDWFNQSWNIIKSDGTLASEEWFKDVGDPSDIGGQCYFKVMNNAREWNIMKPDGTFARKKWFYNVGDPVDIGGECYFRVKNDKGKWTTMKLDGTLTGKKWFDDVGALRDIGGKCYFAVKNNEGKWNVIKPDGFPVSSSWFKYIGVIVDIGGKCYFRAENDEGKWNVIKPDGAPVREEWFRSAGDPINIGGRCYFKAENSEGEWNIIKDDGTPIMKSCFSDIQNILDIGGQCYFWVMNNKGEEDIIRPDGNPVLNRWAESAYGPFADGNALVFLYTIRGTIYKYREVLSNVPEAQISKDKFSSIEDQADMSLEDRQARLEIAVEIKGMSTGKIIQKVLNEAERNGLTDTAKAVLKAFLAVLNLKEGDDVENIIKKLEDSLGNFSEDRELLAGVLGEERLAYVLGEIGRKLKEISARGLKPAKKRKKTKGASDTVPDAGTDKISNNGERRELFENIVSGTRLCIFARLEYRYSNEKIVMLDFSDGSAFTIREARPDNIVVVYDANDQPNRIEYTDPAGKRMSLSLMGHKSSEIKPSAYFGGMSDSEIDPQIKWVLEKYPERFRFVQGQTEEGMKGDMEVSEEWVRMINEAVYEIEREIASGKALAMTDINEPLFSDYNIVVLKGVGFSGHYSSKRGGRIYIPIELLEAVAENRDSPDVTSGQSLFCKIIIDFIEHEYLHSIGWSEEKIIKHSQKMRPGVYETARRLYREYIAKRLVETVSSEVASPEARNDRARTLLCVKLEKILTRVQEGKQIELTETQMHRLLWLIDESNQFGLAKEIAELVNLILEPNYTGNVGQVIMALEKEILLWEYEEKQLEVDSRQSIVNRIKEKEKKKLLKIRRTLKGDLRFEGPEVPENIKNTVNFINRYLVPKPADVKQTHYVLIDEFRAKEYEAVIDEISKKWNVRFITQIPEDVNAKDVVALVDPEDAAKISEVILYLPLVYNEKAFILAAWLCINKPDNIIGTPVYNFVKGFYEELLGETLADTEVVSWFSEPWLLKDKITKISEHINLLRIALQELDKAA